MKPFFTLLFVMATASLFSQTSSYSIEVVQKETKKKLAIKAIELNKAPFAIVFKFITPQRWSLIAGYDTRMQEIYGASARDIGQLVSHAEFGGADSYFNEDLTIKAWGAKTYTNIEYVDDLHHSFDSIYKKGDWIYGVRTIEQLSTPDDYLIVEDWKASSLIVAIANVEYNNKGALASNGVAFKLNLTDIPPISSLDVKGKTYNEIGEATVQEGCEGCGNLAYYHFLSNGKQVDYLRSGSDTGSFGPYTQTGDQIQIGTDISFTVLDNGKTLLNNKYDVRYKLEE